MPGLSVNGCAGAGRVSAGDTAEIDFEPRRLSKTKYICHRLYGEERYGEQIIGISPRQGLYPLFGPFPA